jgi:hypothetical protein
MVRILHRQLAHQEHREIATLFAWPDACLHFYPRIRPGRPWPGTLALSSTHFSHTSEEESMALPQPLHFTGLRTRR